MGTRRLPLSTVTLVFGLLSIPLAFLRQLCVPALIMGLLALLFRAMGLIMQRRHSYAEASIKRSQWGSRMALVGGACALAMWLLWATGVLL